MRVSTQIRVVHWSVTAAALLLAIDVALTAQALVNLDRTHFRMISEQQLTQVRVDMTNTLATAAIAVVVLAVLAVFMRRPTNKVRIAVWIVAPLLALTTLCFLVGGPEWAVAPTGAEPPDLKREYAEAVPEWYTTLHGTAGLLAAALLVFVAVFVARADLREYYMDGADGIRTYRSWVERTGG
jgi:hypothetical protein